MTVVRHRRAGSECLACFSRGDVAEGIGSQRACLRVFLPAGVFFFPPPEGGRCIPTYLPCPTLSQEAARAR